MKRVLPIVVGALVLAVLVLIVVVSPKFKPEPKENLTFEENVINIPSFFCDHMMELSASVEDIQYYDGILNVEFACDLSPEQLAEQIEDKSGIKTLYTVEQYYEAGYTDLLIFAQYDTCLLYTSDKPREYRLYREISFTAAAFFGFCCAVECKHERYRDNGKRSCQLYRYGG